MNYGYPQFSRHLTTSIIRLWLSVTPKQINLSNVSWHLQHVLDHLRLDGMNQPQHPYESDDDIAAVMAAIHGSQQTGNQSDNRSQTYTKKSSSASKTTPTQKINPRDVLETPRYHENTSPSQQHIPLAVPRRRILMSVMVVGLTTAICFGASIGVFTLYKKYSVPKSPITSDIKQKLGTPLYYPASLPTGYSMSKESISLPSDNVLIYTVEQSSGNKLFFSQQKQPGDFNFDEFYHDLKDKQEFKTELGKITTGTMTNGQSIASLPTGETWLMMNTNVGIPKSDLIEIFKKLRKS